MNADAAIESAIGIQNALKVLASLHLTSFLFPRQAAVNDGDHFHFIIVGAGSAGSVIASRLTEIEEFNVLLIEAGDDPPIEVLLPGLFNYVPHSRLDWNYTYQKDAIALQCGVQGPSDLMIGKMLGGSSGSNYMFYVRGNPYDYKTWADAVGDSSWNWKEILPYFIKSERLEDEQVLLSSTGMYHGTDGYLGVTREPSAKVKNYLEALRELGHNIVLDNNGKDTLGYTQPMFTIADGVRQTTAYSFLSPVKDRTNLKVLKNAVVTKVIFDEDFNAVGVKVHINNKTLTLYADLEVILSAGALNTPKLLMLSGVGPEEHLRTLNIKVLVDLPVGYNLQDHTAVFTAHKMEKSTTMPKPPNPTKFPLPSITGYVALNKSQTFPDYQVTIFVIPANSKGVLQLFGVNYRNKKDMGEQMYHSNMGRNIIISIVCKLHPNSRGRVMLASADPEDSPITYTGYFSAESDLEDTVDYLLDYLKLENTKYFRSVHAEMIDLTKGKCKETGRKEYLRCYAQCVSNGFYHYAGTCSMGSVVDGRLRVSGVNRLRVADASVIPYLPSGYINAAVIMIAEKAADMITDDYIKNK